MKPLEVLGVRVEMPTNKPIVLLKETGGRRYLPIWIGAAEASAIAYAQQGVEPPRPLTHDLFVTTIGALGRTLSRVVIASLQDSYFHATLVFDDGTEVDARSSDAIALALRSGAEVVTTEALLADAGVLLSEEEDSDDQGGEGAPGRAEDELERFREFLDQVSAEDFEGLEGQGPREAL
ncbi:bifunctional nuclease family protein [Arsenicicoccus dermatophilus]|uniref:bifunctional nuclease family protein n=1 Tax=Arsenicicoccus dermatophilus TaxID=1076331 RepID=UPI003917284F